MSCISEIAFFDRRHLIASFSRIFLWRRSVRCQSSNSNSYLLSGRLLFENTSIHHFERYWLCQIVIHSSINLIHPPILSWISTSNFISFHIIIIHLEFQISIYLPVLLQICSPPISAHGILLVSLPGPNIVCYERAKFIFVWRVHWRVYGGNPLHNWAIWLVQT